jgi:hypothetical protein
MAQPTLPAPALLILAAFSRHDGALDWSRRRAIEAFGPPLMESPPFAFDDTSFYRSTMGSQLKKIFFAFDNRFNLDNMAQVKLMTNRWEEDYAEANEHVEPRPLNLDPGYLHVGKLVLASTKGHAHRIYLCKGIHAEVTLVYRHGRWQAAGQWTFEDYRRDDYHRFFTQCREYLLDKQNKEAAQ